MKNYIENYELWLNSEKLNKDEKNELLSIANNEDEIKSRFSSNLVFGTGGLRAIMKTGMNAMNTHTISHATQGLASHIISVHREADGVVIASDSRNNAKEFTKAAAAVLAANGIKVYLFESMRPTPELSFALRELCCVAGINVTASHNTREYNGYKVYWDDGAQLSPEYAEKISSRINETDIFTGVKTMDFDTAVRDGQIQIIGNEMDIKYIDTVLGESIDNSVVSSVANDFRVVYTPLHGTGYKMVPAVLQRLGVTKLHSVEEQMIPNGDFPTVAKPNPEFFETFELGIKKAREVNSDLILATDPDADRVGVCIKNSEGEFFTLTGNQVGALLLDYIITALKKADKMPENSYAVKSIVSTELATKICKENDIRLYNVLTGFKYIGEVIKLNEERGQYGYIFGFEESCGYLKGTYARDKDAVLAAMLITEMAAYYKTQSMTLFDALNGLYEKYGFYAEMSDNFVIKSLNVTEQMTSFMNSICKNPPKDFGEATLVSFGDYNKQQITNIETGDKTPTNLPISEVFSFGLDSGDTIIVRPSGTEPKVKIYYLLCGKNEAETNEKLTRYRKIMSTYTDKLK